MNKFRDIVWSKLERKDRNADGVQSRDEYNFMSGEPDRARAPDPEYYLR